MLKKKERKKESCLVEYIQLLKFYFERLINFHAVVRNYMYIDFPGGANDKEPTWQWRRHKRCGFDPWVGKMPGRGNDNTLHYSYLENPMGWGARQATVHRVAKNQTQLKWLSMHMRVCVCVCHASFSQLPPTTCKMILKYHKQDADTDTLKIQNSSPSQAWLLVIINILYSFDTLRMLYR